MDLDDVDLALLRELKRDGRASFETLGTRVGVSRTAARARVVKLRSAGAVRFEAVVHPAVDGIGAFGHVSVTTADAPSRQVADGIAALGSARFVSVVAGRFSVIAELRTRDLGEMGRAVAAVRDLPGVVSLDVLLYTDVVKDPRLPLGGPHEFVPPALDDLDRRLLALLQQDARTPYAELADAVGLSRGATGARVRRLLDEGVVVATGITDGTALGRTQMCGFQAHLRAGSHGVDGVDGVVEAVAAMDDVDFLALTVGRADLVGTLISRSRSDVRAALDAIRAADGVHSLEAWWHLELVKETYAPPAG